MDNKCYKLKRLYLTTIFIFASTYGFANHLIGGELSYRCEGGNNYLIELSIYRNCNCTMCADFDDPASLTIFDGNNTFLRSEELSLTGRKQIHPNIEGLCVETIPDVCVEKTLGYKKNINLSSSTSGYRLVYQRCCRNNTINNIVNPDDTGSTYEVIIPPRSIATCNNSPVFDNFPPIVICAGFPLEFNNAAYDLDGDSLVYELCTPYGGATPRDPRPTVASKPPYAPIVWEEGFDEKNQIGESMLPLEIDPVSGKLTGFPTIKGQYVVGICVKEYRNNQLLSTSIRDFQFSIKNCDILKVELNGLAATYCVGDTLSINLDNLPESKNWYVNGIEIDLFKDQNEISHLISDDDLGYYTIRLEYNCNGLWLNHVDSVKVHPKLMPRIISSHQQICNNEILELKVDTTYNNYAWTIKDETGQTIFEDKKPTVSLLKLEEGGYYYSVQVTDFNGCVSDVVEDRILVSPGVNIITPSDVLREDTVCNGSKVFYGNSKDLIMSSNSSNLTFRNQSGDLSIVEWNNYGIFSNNTTCGKIVTTVKKSKAPNGRILTFGNSNTMVFADSDYSANYLEYQWFYLDLNENAESIYHLLETATERIIDCNNFNCIFVEKDNQVLALEIYDNRNGCTNLIFYDIHNFFKDSMDVGLEDIPVAVNELAYSNVFNLYPTLNKGSFYIEISATNAPTNQFELEIYNTLGELISLVMLTTQNRQKIGLPYIELGIYFAILKQANQAIAQHKFIVH